MNIMVQLEQVNFLYFTFGQGKSGVLVQMLVYKTVPLIQNPRLFKYTNDDGESVEPRSKLC